MQSYTRGIRADPGCRGATSPVPGRQHEPADEQCEAEDQGGVLRIAPGQQAEVVGDDHHQAAAEQGEHGHRDPQGTAGPGLGRRRGVAVRARGGAGCGALGPLGPLAPLGGSPGAGAS